MPAEPMTVLLRPRNFFAKNPAMDVPPSLAKTPSQVADVKGKGEGANGTTNGTTNGCHGTDDNVNGLNGKMESVRV